MHRSAGAVAHGEIWRKRAATEKREEEGEDSKARILVSMAEFEGQRLVVRGGEVFCEACRVPIESDAFLLRQHCFRSSAPSARSDFERQSVAQRMLLEHYKYVQDVTEEERKRAALLEAIALNRRRLLERAPGACEMPRNVDDEDIAGRVLAFEALAGAGLPLSHLDNPAFLSLFGERGACLGGQRGVWELRSFVQQRQRDALCKLLDGRMIGLFIDASMEEAPIEATIARFVRDDGDIGHVCIGLSRVNCTLDAAQLKGLVQLHLDEMKLSKRQVAALVGNDSKVRRAMGVGMQLTMHRSTLCVRSVSGSCSFTQTRRDC